MTEQQHEVQSRRPANPRSLTVADLARLTGISDETLRDHIARGAPVGPDGKVDLIHYAAWLARATRGNSSLVR